ncbi:glycosyltransferase family 4 protein [Winogradskyella sp. ECml5-4]|uniref:glycosyltransferase family 4 protein n=1 Tax=Winogradskyella sp. ECml5-4 TaxID=3110975 RepID=UPI002FF02D4A
MKNLLYIGNALSNNSSTATTIDTLSEHLKDTFSIKVASNKSNKILRLLDMIRLVISNRRTTDFVLIDTYSTVNFYYALVISQLCRFYKIKYVTILHGGNLENRLKHSSKLSHLIFDNAYKLVAPSHFLKSVFESYNYKDVLYIPNNIEIDNYDFYSRSIDCIKLLWVRSFSSIYNPELAILVLEKLLEKNYNAQLTMVGPEVDGSLKKVKDLAESKQLQVNFTGKLSKVEWLALSKDSNIFINTTNFDNTPVSVIEAMALGLPIVSTNVGGLPFLITNNVDGLLVEPNNVDAMVDAIIKLDEKNRSELVNNARLKVENFDWSVIKPKWEALLS